MLVQALLEVDEIAALSQSHFLGDAGQLIQVWRKVSDSSNSGLRKFVKFHAGPQAPKESNQLCLLAQVLLESRRI